MNARKILLISMSKGKKYLSLALISLFIVVCLNAVILALFVSNPLEGKSIIIDPGHGGIDPGTNDAHTFYEKDINLQISLKLNNELQRMKSFVNMTRTDDRSLDSLIASNAGRHQKDLMARVEKFNNGAYDLFVSIHVNRSSNRNTRGPIVLYSPKSFENSFLAQCVQNRLNQHAKKYCGNDFEPMPLKSSFYILKNANIPGVIVETGFISNPEEKRYLTEDAYQSKISKAISLGISDYFQDIEKARLQNMNDGGYPQQEETPFNITNEIRFVIRAD